MAVGLGGTHKTNLSTLASDISTALGNTTAGTNDPSVIAYRNWLLIIQRQLTDHMTELRNQ